MMSVVVGELKWYRKEDVISINVVGLNFAKPNRGGKSKSMKGIIPEKITRRDCAGKVAEVWKSLGRVRLLRVDLK